MLVKGATGVDMVSDIGRPNFIATIPPKYFRNNMELLLFDKKNAQC